MKWSKLKKSAEGLLADSLKGRVKYHLARYGPGVSYIMVRGWITFNRKQIVNCSTVKSIQEHYKLTGQYFSDDKEASEQLHEQGVFTRDDFVDALEEYVGLKIEEALNSANALIRAFAMFDRRLGKRRLVAMFFTEDECPLVKDFYAIRRQAEGLPLKTKPS